MELINIKENKNLISFKKWLIKNKIKTNDIFISGGWIDSHVHIFKKSVYNYSNYNYKNLKGIVAAIDAGSTGINTIKEAINENNTRPFKLFYLLNLASDGLLKKDELNKPNFNLKKLKAMGQLEDVLGYKMRYSSQAINNDNKNYIKILKKTKKLKLPIMYHVGHEPPKFSTLIKYIKNKDVITHTYHNKNANIDNYLKDNPVNYFDVGFGNESFSFDKFNNFNKSGFKPDIISSDIHNNSAINLNCSVQSIISIFINNGFSLEETIKMVTTNPINIFNIKNKSIQDSFTCFRVVKKKKILIDSYGQKMKIEKTVEPIATWIKRKGHLYE